MEQSSRRIIAIHECFEETEYGRTLAARVRYERYKPAEVANERWIQLLGADVNNLTHMPLTYGLAQDFIRTADRDQSYPLDDSEKELLQVAALTHDWAEAIVGDITFGDKTDEDERAEAAAFDAYLSGFYTGKEAELIQKAREEIIFDHSGDTKLGRVFNAIERVGYMRTALRAHAHLVTDDAQDCENGLTWLVADVLSQQPIPLIEHAKTLPPVRQYLQNQGDIITEAFKSVSSEVFENYPLEQRTLKQDAFGRSYLAWQEWISM
jgi:hypothetical protein